jgi:hypothetical protein
VAGAEAKLVQPRCGNAVCFDPPFHHRIAIAEAMRPRDAKRGRGALLATCYFAYSDAQSEQHERSSFHAIGPEI